MVCSDSDDSVVTEILMRDLRRAEEERVQREAEKKLTAEQEAELSDTHVSKASADEPAVAQTTVAVPPPAPERPADPEATGRYIRLGIVAVLVVVFFCMWVSQRRNKS